MIRKVSSMATIKDVREMYRLDNKYWKTGDVDILSARIAAGKKIDERFYTEVCSLASIVTRKCYPVQKLVDALRLLGFEITEDEAEEKGGHR